MTDTTSGLSFSLCDTQAAVSPLQCVIIYTGSVFTVLHHGDSLLCSLKRRGRRLIFKHADFSRSLCICIYKADSLTEVSIRSTAGMQDVRGGDRGQR